MDIWHRYFSRCNDETDSSDEEEEPEVIEGETPEPFDGETEEQVDLGDLFPQDTTETATATVNIEWRKEDQAYNAKLENFLKDGCGCKKT